MANSTPLTPLRRGVASGAIAVFAFGFLAEGYRTLDRGSFSYTFSAAGKRSRGVQQAIHEPHARRIGAGCLVVGAAVLLWSAVVLVLSLRGTSRRRTAVSLASGLLLAAGVLLWLPPWVLWPNSPLLLAYGLPLGVALLWRLTRTSDPVAREMRRTRGVLVLLGLLGLLGYRFGVGVLAGAAVGVVLVILAVVHRRFAAPAA